jgi:hypothetical protein
MPELASQGPCYCPQSHNCGASALETSVIDDDTELTKTLLGLKAYFVKVVNPHEMNPAWSWEILPVENSLSNSTLQTGIISLALKVEVCSRCLKTTV